MQSTCKLNSLKFIACIALLLSLLIQTFSYTFIVVDYYTARAAYLEKCENKARPLLHCDGKCQLAKKIKQNRQAEEKEGNISFKFEVFSSHSYYTISDIKLVAAKQQYAVFITPATITRSGDISHPPQLA